MILANTLLVFALLVKLRTTPAHVYSLITTKQSEMKMITDATAQRQVEVLEVLMERGEWMEALTSELNKAGNLRWRSTDEQQAWDEFFDANPTLRVPGKFLPEHIQPEPSTLPPPPR